MHLPEHLAPYAGLLLRACERWSVDPFVVAGLVQFESGGNPDAVSAAGAVGLGQVMPRDGVKPGVNWAWFAARPTAAELLDPETNVDWTACLLAGYVARWGTVEQGLAQYLGAIDSRGRITGRDPFTGVTGNRYVDGILRLADQYREANPMRSVCWDGDWPVTQIYGVNPAAYAQFGYRGHNGLDIGLPNGTRLYAPTDGTVAFAGNDHGGYGWNIYALSTDGGAWICAHMTAGSLSMAFGDVVSRGEYLGLSDNTGNSTGPHLHFGRRPPNWNSGNGYGGWIDPLPWLQALGEGEEEDVAELEELRAKVLELVSTNSALDDQVRALRAEIDGLHGMNSDLAGQLAHVQSLKQEVEAALTQQLGELQARLDATKQTARRVVGGAGTLRLQYSDESTEEVRLGLSTP